MVTVSLSPPAVLESHAIIAVPNEAPQTIPVKDSLTLPKLVPTEGSESNPVELSIVALISNIVVLSPIKLTAYQSSLVPSLNTLSGSDPV